MERLFNKVFGQLESGQIKKIENKLKKGKEANVKLVTSTHFYGKGSNGHHIDDDATVNSLDEYSGEIGVDMPSTAVQEVRYVPNSQDPAEGVCWVRFVGGKGKWYRYEHMSPQQFKSFMNASSKGRYLNKVMRVKNRAEGY